MQNLFSDLKAKTYNKHDELEQSTPFAFFERKADVMYYHEMQIANIQEACGVRFEPSA